MQRLHRSPLVAGALAALAVAVAPGARADVKLPAIFGDHMVVQAGKPVPIWGVADPGERVTVSAGGQSREVRADAAGGFRVDLDPIGLAAPFSITVSGRNTVIVDDVVVGEVWLASGQSNMEWPLAMSTGGEAEIDRARDPELRLFQVARAATFHDRPADVDARWALASPESAEQFSAVAYHFARELRAALGRPVGVVHSSWGGTPAEAWTRREALAAAPSLRHLAGPPLDPAAREARAAAHREAVAAWEKDNVPVDEGNRGEALGLARPEQPTTGWQPVWMPAPWKTSGLDVAGAVWLRKQATLPPELTGRALTLRLGTINDCDVAYVNGERIGATCRDEAPRFRTRSRRYPVPARLTASGRVTVAVRVFAPGADGGFSGDRDALRLHEAGKPEGPSVPLQGEWLAKVEAALPRRPPGPEAPKPPPGVFTQNSPGVLWDNMLATIAPFPVRGAIWYQGESNAGRAFQYRTLLPVMIADWRRAFADAKLPFLIVQLAAYRPRLPIVGQQSAEDWAELREAQLLVARKDPAAGLAVTIDIGERDDIHPRNKAEVGRRLALAARARVYGEAVAYSGPVYEGFKVEKDRIRVRFSHADGLRIAPDSGRRLFGFEIAGADRRFVGAAAEIDGDTVIVSAPGIERPVAVRYGWSDYPICNLTNQAGLPASPFRTDDFPLLTARRK